MKKLLTKKENLVNKKMMKEHIARVKNTNRDVQQLLIFILNNRSNPEIFELKRVEEGLKNSIEHMDNMNFIFSKMEESNN